MPVLPDEVTATSFRMRWRGYDRGQVDGFLRQVGADYGGAIDRIAAVSEERARARTEREELDGRLGELTDCARRAAAKIRADADADAAAARERAEHAAALITRQAEVLRAAAQADADGARQRLEDADRRAHQLEDAARDRWEALRADTEARFEQLQIAERRFADRVRHVESSLNVLRSQVALLDQVQQLDQVLTELRAEAVPIRVPTDRGNGTSSG